MSTVTVTSRIKSAEDAAHYFDLSTFNDCPEHKLKPNITLLKWGRNNQEFSARCRLCPEEKSVFGGLSNNPAHNKWNKFNPLPTTEKERTPDDLQAN